MTDDVLLDVQPRTGGFALAGEIDSASAPLLARHLDPLPAGDDRIVLDLSQVEFIDSSGLRTLIDAHLRAEDAGRQLIMSAPSRAVARLFEIAGMGTILHIEDAASDATD